MKQFKQQWPMWVMLCAVAMLAGCATMDGRHQVNVVLSGTEEVPPVVTKATGSGTIVIAADKSVSGSVTTTGVAGIAAHIHLAPAGKNGPVIVPMKRLRTTSGQSRLDRSSPTRSTRASRRATCT